MRQDSVNQIPLKNILKMLWPVIFCGLLALVRSQSTPVSQCIYHSAPLPINTYIEDCLNPPCQLPQLQDVVLNIIFQAPHTMRTMRTLATAYILGPFGIPYDLGEEAATCNFLTNTYCPVIKDEVITYTLRMFIESFFPIGTSVTIEFRIVDDNNSPVVCIRVPVAITAALPSAGGTASGKQSRNNSTILDIIARQR